MELAISSGAEKIIQRLEQGGFSAFVTGGAVRDLLMERSPHDFDIATSAQPPEIKHLFNRCIDTGISHGTVTVIEDKVGYEVTTFRKDGTYTDGRRPDTVEFVKDIREDLSRRDFTVNALAYNKNTGVIDLFGGINDMKQKRIRCVGDPEQRFMEDALRMLRAVRFSAVLGFEIEENTARAIKKCAVLIKRVSRERILEECNKILMSPNPDFFRQLHELGLLVHIIPQLERCFGEPQRNKFHIYDVGEHIIQTIKRTPKDLSLRWAGLMHDVGKPCCSSTDSNGIIHFYGHHKESVRITEETLRRLRMDSDTIRDICVLIEYHDVRIEASLPAAKRILSKIGETLFEKLLLLQEADNGAKNPVYFEEKMEKLKAVRQVYETILAEGQPYRLSDLVINGRDLIKLKYKAGRQIGDTLKTLLDEVMINPSLNNRDYLLKRARELKQR